jgi:hypothetical protein
VKLVNIKYNKDSSEWYSPEYVPDTPRSVLIYIEDGGVAEATFHAMENKWVMFRWNCQVEPIKWRELPKYEG